MPRTAEIAKNVRSLEEILENAEKTNPKLWEVSRVCIALADVPIASGVPEAVIITQAHTKTDK